MDFFVMTRRERRGTIVVLLLIAMILISTVAVRSCRSQVPSEIQQADMVQFESSIDSARNQVTKTAPAKKSHATKRKSQKKKPSPRPSKPASRPQRMDPVPQF